MSKNYLQSFLKENGLDKGEFFVIYNASALPVGSCVETNTVYRFSPVAKELRVYKTPSCDVSDLAYAKTVLKILRGEVVIYKVSDILKDTPHSSFTKTGRWVVRKDVSLDSSNSYERDLTKGNICIFDNYDDAKKKFDEM